LVFYLILVTRYGGLVIHQSGDAAFDLLAIIKFFIAMTGASVIGESMFARFHVMWPYFICGAILIFWLAILSWLYVKEQAKGQLFLLAIAAYSLTNILAVSVFRVSNGFEGALGSWYYHHTQFIAVAVIFYLVSTLSSSRTFFVAATKLISIGLILYLAAFEYYYQWKKAPHIAVWKEQFLAQVPSLLANSDKIKDKSKSWNTMLWDFGSAKAGIEFLYSEKLWIFKEQSIKTFGLTADGWMEADRGAAIICPEGSTGVKFKIWRPGDWPKSTVNMSYGRSHKDVQIINQDIHLPFAKGKPVVSIDASDLEKSSPVSSGGDVRKLVAIVGSAICESCQCSDCLGEADVNASSDLDLDVFNWGPQTAELGTVPNLQADGNMGIWIEVSDTTALGELQVTFDGKLANSVVVQKKLITVSIASEYLKSPGGKEMVIEQVRGGNKKVIGTFKVNAN